MWKAVSASQHGRAGRLYTILRVEQPSLTKTTFSKQTLNQQLRCEQQRNRLQGCIDRCPRDVPVGMQRGCTWKSECGSTTQPLNHSTTQPTAQPLIQPLTHPTTRECKNKSSQLKTLQLNNPTTQLDNSTTQPTTQPLVQPLTHPTTRECKNKSPQLKTLQLNNPTTQPLNHSTTQPLNHSTTQPTTQPLIQPLTHPTTRECKNKSSQLKTLQLNNPTTQPLNHSTSLSFRFQ